MGARSKAVTSEEAMFLNAVEAAMNEKQSLANRRGWGYIAVKMAERSGHLMGLVRDEFKRVLLGWNYGKPMESVGENWMTKRGT